MRRNRSVVAPAKKAARARTKSRIRGLVHRGVRDEKAPRVVRRTGSPPSPVVCERCGAVYARKTWRAGERATKTQLMGVLWTVCPACKQVAAGEYFGRVRLTGAFVEAHEEELRGRIRTAAARARFTQPERRIVSIDRDSEGMTVLTTSQKLAHRIAREVEKAFGGSTTYAWTKPHGELQATWRRDDVPSRVERRTIGAGRPRRYAPFDLEIQTKHVDLDPRWRDLIEGAANGLAKRFPEVLRLHATLTHGHHHKRGLEHAALVVNVPDSVVRVSKDEERMTDAIHAAFDAAARDLDQYHRQRRHFTKRPNPRVRGSIKRIFRDAGYGFILLPGGRQAYFSRRSLDQVRFRDLKPGVPVEVEIEEGAEGPQASRVYPARSRG